MSSTDDSAHSSSFSSPPTSASSLTSDSNNDEPKFSTEHFRSTRDEIVGPEDGPRSPFPVEMKGDVQRGFGRGGKDLGCPTANLPDEALQSLNSATSTGIYFGYAQVRNEGRRAGGKDVGTDWMCEEDTKVYPMAMSLGRNPFYENENLSAEVHIMHNFQKDFYGKEMRVLVLGYIRPELNYTSREALIDDIEMDKKVAIRSLARPAYAKYQNNSFFTSGLDNGSVGDGSTKMDQGRL